MELTRLCQRVLNNDHCYRESAFSRVETRVWRAYGEFMEPGTTFDPSTPREEVRMEIAVRKVEAVNAAASGTA